MSAPSNRWSLTRTVQPTDTPVELPWVKNWLRVVSGDNTQDIVLTGLIQAATSFVESIQWRQLMTATYVLTLDFFPSWELKIPMPTLQSISSIDYLDTEGNSQVLSPSLYVIDANSQPGRVTPAYSQIWPITRYQMAAVSITYLAGYANRAAVPHTTKTGIMALVAGMYENRESDAAQAAERLPWVQQMLESERVLDFSGPMGSSSNVPMAVSAWGGDVWLN